MSRLSTVLEAANHAPSADNSQPWQLNWDGNMLTVHFRPHPGIDPFGPGGHATLLSIGALAENLAQALPEQTETICVNDLTRGAPYFSIRVDQTPAPSIHTEPALFKRHTNRYRFGSELPDADLLRGVLGLADSPTKLHEVITHHDRGIFADLTQTCCKARFCNRELHDWLMGSLRFSDMEADKGDGLDIATLDLPPGGGWFMKMIRPWPRMALLNTVGMYHLMALAEALPLRQAPLIIAISGPDSPEGAFAAGRSMERIWIHLNQLGWAVHPYYVVADQETRLRAGLLPDEWKMPIVEALDKLVALLELKPGNRLHMALRVGRPTRTPKRSRRLPIERIYTDTRPTDANEA